MAGWVDINEGEGGGTSIIKVVLDLHFSCWTSLMVTWIGRLGSLERNALDTLFIFLMDFSFSGSSFLSFLRRGGVSTY